MPGPVVLMALGASLVLTVADDLPKFDVAANCKAVAKVPIADAQSPENCIRDEESARATLEGKWQSYPAAARSRCAAETQVGGSPSYVDILTCLQMAQEAGPVGTPLLGKGEGERGAQ